MGCTYRRLDAKLAAKCWIALLSETLRPIQLGVVTPGGCEALVHVARKFSGFTPANRNKPKVLVKVDITNAYNSIHRSAVLAVIREKCPQIYPMM